MPYTHVRPISYQAAKALQAAGFDATAIAGMTKDIFGVSTEAAAQILDSLGINADTTQEILKAVGYPASEIENAMNEIFDWFPHIKF